MFRRALTHTMARYILYRRAKGELTLTSALSFSRTVSLFCMCVLCSKQPNHVADMGSGLVCVSGCYE